MPPRTSVDSPKMQPRNYGALALLCAALFFERFAYYGFRSTLMLRLRDEAGEIPASIGTTFTLISLLLVVGFAAGGALSIATRNRFLLLGMFAGLAGAHVAGAFSAKAGAFAIALFAGIVRPLMFLAMSEELDREARLWKAVAIAACVQFVSNLGASLSAFAGGQEHASTGTHLLPVVFVVLGLVSVLILALACPGKPFDWAENRDQILPGASGLYRPEPQVLRASQGPTFAAVGLATAAGMLSASAQTLSSHAGFETMYRSGEAMKSTRNMLYHMLNPSIESVLALVLLGVGAYLASTRSKLSPAWISGTGLGVLGLSAFVMAASAATSSSALAIVSSLFDGLGEGFVFPIVMAYFLAAPSSKWAGAVGAALAVLYYLPSLVVSPIAAILHETALTVALVLMGLVCLTGSVITLVFGPKLDRASA